ncbi:MAG TPA: Ig-like domain-containing protein [Candidatus Angelobacter sp.]|nr:Ig-like domain-containing protein [Candidatus Angelobacter sp.]
MTQTATKRRSVIGVAFFFMTAAAFAGVSVSTPSAGSTNSSPVHFAASASGSSPISAMRIYVDSNSAFLVNAGSLNTSLSMGNGSHSISVQAWDTQGHVYVNNFSISVGGSSAPPPPSGSGTTFSMIEQMGGWQSCTTCAGAGGNGPSAAFWTKQFVGSPSQNGKSMQFFLGGSHPYSDALWWKQLGANNGVTHFQYDVDFYLTSPQDAQALEFDINQSNGSRKFIFGTQCNIRGGGVWDVWDTANHVWRHTGVGCSMPSAFTWHHLTWQVYRDSSSTHFVSVTLDGATHYVNATYGSEPMGASEINVAFQMDGDFAQHNYSAWLNFVTLRYW